MEPTFKEKRKKVLVDASSAILLAKVGLSTLLCETYVVIMAGSVFDEITVHTLPGSGEYLKLHETGNILLEDPKLKNLSGLPAKLQNLGKGERDTLLLFYEGVGDFLLTDDGEAAQFCHNNHIPFINALLFPLVLETAGLQNQSFRHYYFNILKIEGRYSAKVLDFASNCPTASISFSLP
jgi:predicted nucleic acid-binding protein